MVRYVGPDDAATAVRAAWPEVVAGRRPGAGVGARAGVDPDAAATARPAPSSTPSPRASRASWTPARWPRSLRRSRGGPLADAADRVLLTPHAGELARLLGRAGGRNRRREEVEAAPYAHAARAAAATGATVLLKGATTLVVRPDGARPQPGRRPAVAGDGGRGDVLAGIAGALLAGGLGAWRRRAPWPR